MIPPFPDRHVLAFPSSHLHSAGAVAAFELAAELLLDYRSTVDKHSCREILLPDEKSTNTDQKLRVPNGWVEGSAA